MRYDLRAARALWCCGSLLPMVSSHRQGLPSGSVDAPTTITAMPGQGGTASGATPLLLHALLEGKWLSRTSSHTSEIGSLFETVLGLDHWEITVVEAASDVDAWADIEAHAQQPTADLRVSFDFWKQTPEKQRLILTHELMHLVVARYARIAENLDALGSVAWAGH